MIWNPEMETMPVEQRKALQLKRIQETVNRVYDKVPAYRAKMDKVKVKPGDIKSLEDIKALPFLMKADMRENYPFGLFTVPLEDVVRIHTSSGTTGKPTVVGYTRSDLEVWSELMARTLVCGGASKNSILQVAFGYGLFTGGLGAHYGAEKIGASVIPASAGQTKRQIMMFQDFGTEVFCSTPSYALLLAETLEEMGVDITTLKLRHGIFGAEPWSESIRAEIERRLNITAIDIYGLSEVIGPGVSSECLEQKGMHVFDDHFYPEIIDPETGEPLPEGKTGELVITSLTKVAFPLIRYRTRDITSLNFEPCKCGRTHVRMARVTGRTDDMLIIRGVNVFPSQIETVLLQVEGTLPHYMIYVKREGSLDALEVHVEVDEKVFSDEIKKVEGLKKRIEKELISTLGVSAKVKLVEPKSIQRSEGKAKRVIDERKA